MNWDAVSAIAEIVGAIAIVITLIYLAVQIRQNTRSTKYQTTQNLVKASSNANFMIAGDSEVAEIMRKGSVQPESLSDDERLRYNAWFYAYYNQLDFAYHQFLSGQLERVMWDNLARDIPLFLGGLPGATEWWQRDKVRFSKEFTEYVELRLSNFKPPEWIPTINVPAEPEG